MLFALYANMALTNTPPTNPYQFYGWYEFVRIGVRPPIPLLVMYLEPYN